MSPPYEILEFTLVLDNGSLKIPIALFLESQFPSVPPRIFLRSRLRHRFFEVGNHGPEIMISNFFVWSRSNTLLQLVNALKATLEQDPPKQEKIVEDVNAMLSKINPEDFKELVNSEWLNGKTPQEIKSYAASPNFEEVICCSKQYKKIAQNIIDCASFNEKIANELMQKQEVLENSKQNLSLLCKRIVSLREELAQKQERCKRFADRFSRPNLEKCINDELMKLDTLSEELDQGLSIGNTPFNKITPTGNNLEDTLSIYFETRKKISPAFHFKGKVAFSFKLDFI